mgnify:CR=1 FL=1
MTKTYRISGPKDEVAVDSLKDELSLVDGTHEVELDLCLLYTSDAADE